MAIKNVSQYYSCRRKRDYVTALALILFAVMLVGQIYLVLVLPVKLSQQEALEYHVSSQQMLRQMDVMRNKLGTLYPDGVVAKGETELLRSIFNQLQIYVRENRDNMTLPQIVQVSKTCKMLDSVYQRCKANQYHIRRETLCLPDYVKTLEDLIRQKESESL